MAFFTCCPERHGSDSLRPAWRRADNSISRREGRVSFEISALPYAQLDLTLDRLGAPSGASDQSDHLEIVDVMRDDLFTVYFTKNGVQYVVVTMPELESWLIEILKTWEFTD